MYKSCNLECTQDDSRTEPKQETHLIICTCLYVHYTGDQITKYITVQRCIVLLVSLPH